MPELGKNLISTLDEKDKTRLLTEISDHVIFELGEFNEVYTEAEDAYRYLAGEHYLPEQKEWFKTNDRPVRAFNLIFPRMNQVMGDFLLSNQKRKVFALPGGDGRNAELLQKLLDQFYAEKEVRFELIMTALAGICKMGYAYPHIDNDRNIDGELFMKNVNEFEVIFDSRAQHPFLDDAAYMARLRKADPVDLKNMWPEHRTKLGELLDIRNEEEKLQSWLEQLGPREKKLAFHADMYDRVDGKYTIVEYHRFEWKRATIFTDLITGTSEIWPENLHPRKQEVFLSLHPAHKFSERIAKVKVITTVVPALNYVLEHYEAPLQDRQYDLVKFSFYPYGKKAIRDFGVFKNAKEPQDAFNEWENKKQDILYKVANPGFTYKPSLLENPQDIELYSSRPGLNTAVKPEAPTLDAAIKRNDFTGRPDAVVKLAKDGSDLLDKVMGMAANFLYGQTQTSNENASLFAQRIQQTQQAFQIGYSQWARALQRVDNKAIKLMQLFYQTERVVMITTPQSGDPQMLLLNAQVGGRVINDINRGKYESIVDDQNSTPTMRLLRFRLKTELLSFLGNLIGPNLAAAVPWDWYLRDAIDLGDVEPLIQGLQQLMRSQGAQAEEDQAIQRVYELVEGARQQLDLQQKAAGIVSGGQNGGVNGKNGRPGMVRRPQSIGA